MDVVATLVPGGVPPAQTIKLLKIVRHLSGLGLRESKEVAERLKRGETFDLFRVPGPADREALLSCGVRVEVNEDKGGAPLEGNNKKLEEAIKALRAIFAGSKEITTRDLAYKALGRIT